MEIQAKVKNALITPQKARMMINLLRGKSTAEALAILEFVPRKTALIVKKLIQSAIANAVHNFGLDKNNLYIKSIEAQKGIVLKRWMPRAHGHATPILKRRSHLKISLAEVRKSDQEKIGRKSEMQTFSYEEVKKAIEEAKKATKNIEKKDAAKKKKPALKGMKQGGISPQTAQDGTKKIAEKKESQPKFNNLGNTFKKLLYRSSKKV